MIDSHAGVSAISGVLRRYLDSLWGDKPFAGVGPILKLLYGHVVAELAAGTAGEERPRDVDHMRRALALIEQRRAAPGTEASGRSCRLVLEASDVLRPFARGRLGGSIRSAFP